MGLHLPHGSLKSSCPQRNVALPFAKLGNWRMRTWRFEHWQINCAKSFPPPRNVADSIRMLLPRCFVRVTRLAAVLKVFASDANANLRLGNRASQCLGKRPMEEIASGTDDARETSKHEMHVCPNNFNLFDGFTERQWCSLISVKTRHQMG